MQYLTEYAYALQLKDEYSAFELQGILNKEEDVPWEELYGVVDRVRMAELEDTAPTGVAVFFLRMMMTPAWTHWHHRPLAMGDAIVIGGIPIIYIISSEGNREPLDTSLRLPNWPDTVLRIYYKKFNLENIMRAV